MDPEATLNRAEEALCEGDVEEALSALGDLADWRSRGGFMPADGDARFESLFQSTMEIATL